MVKDFYNREVVLKDGTELLVTRRLSASKWVGTVGKKERTFGLDDIAEVKHDRNGFGILQ